MVSIILLLPGVPGLRTLQSQNLGSLELGGTSSNCTPLCKPSAGTSTENLKGQYAGVSGLDVLCTLLMIPTLGALWGSSWC